jgi:hypothetical protein
MLDHVEGFGKVKFENNDLSFGLMTLVKKFKTPSETTLNGPFFYETILALVDNFEDYSLKAVGEEFSE